jgi:hypothetical protein
MVKFIKHISILLLFYLVGLEITLRIFELSRFSVPTRNINGNYLYKPNVSGYYLGGGMGEIRSKYKINNQGWNSSINYDFKNPIELKNKNIVRIALIGDSYVEGFHVDVNHSIGRLIDSISNNRTITYEYGGSDGNFEDFKLIYKSYIDEKFNYVFILLSNKDIAGKKASFMGRADKVANTTLLRKVYNNSAFLSYLNINRHITTRILGIKPKFFLENHNINENDKSIIINNDDWQFPKNVYFIYEPGNLDVELISRETGIAPSQFVKLKYDSITAINFGFDKHWNNLGRKECAKRIMEVINAAD